MSTLNYLAAFIAFAPLLGTVAYISILVVKNFPQLWQEWNEPS